MGTKAFKDSQILKMKKRHVVVKLDYTEDKENLDQKLSKNYLPGKWFSSSKLQVYAAGI